MAPRATDVVRHSLVPKPLNIKMPPPAAETSRSPSQTTSSPSSVEDPDAASLDGERREAPSFKQTYLSVHSRQHRNGSTVSPLAALRDPGPKPLRERMDRPGTLRSHTGPKLSDHYSTDIDIYFLPKISPTSDSSADEREPLMRTSYPKRMDKASTSNISKAKKPDVDPGSLRSTKVDRRKEALKDGAVAVSPGLQRYYEYLASQKNAVLIKEKGKESEKLHQSKKNEENVASGRPDSGSSTKKKKRGRGLLRLMKAYSKHVEGLQMIQ
ncbi:MAG: hypothetical protein Q9161_008070 [Pseudevernia consocians]